MSPTVFILTPSVSPVSVLSLMSFSRVLSTLTFLLLAVCISLGMLDLKSVCMLILMALWFSTTFGGCVRPPLHDAYLVASVAFWQRPSALLPLLALSHVGVV